MMAGLRKLWRFHGGLHLEEHKAQSLQGPIEHPSLPAVLRIQLRQHIGNANEPLVEVGEHVLKGQIIGMAHGRVAAPVHAPTSGRITRIGSMPVPHLSGLPGRCAEIETDGCDTWVAREPRDDYRALSPQHLATLVHEHGVVGLGGALFPTAIKLSPRRDAVQTLVINAAECEPYISCDEAVMIERADAIATGIDIARIAVGAQRVLVGIEDNKPRAIARLREALEAGSLDIELIEIPTRYPTGGERQLIKVLTGREIPSGGLPGDIGVRVLNVATALSIERAVVHDEPLISRIVTVTGDAVARSANLEVLIGTPIADLVAHCGGYLPGVRELTMGGPMMGYNLPDDSLPVIKSTNCLIASRTANSVLPDRERACIRCGMCADVCPAQLLPQQLFWYARARDLDKVGDYHLADCIECGACDYVCPSRIPLVHYFRYAKSEVAAEAAQRHESEVARQRFEARKERLASIQRDKEARLAAKKEALNKGRKDVAQGASAGNDKDVIAAALARVQAKKQRVGKSSDSRAGENASEADNAL